MCSGKTSGEEAVLGGETGDWTFDRGEDMGELITDEDDGEDNVGESVIMREREGSSRTKGKEGLRKKREVEGIGELLIIG